MSGQLPIDSIFQRTVRVWLPERLTDPFAASVKVRSDVLQALALALQVATVF